MKKPIQLRLIFILNALMMFLPFVFYVVFHAKDIVIDGLDTILFVYTGLAYILSFGILVYLILNKKIAGIRAVFLLNILIAIPASAYLGILVAIISILLSFHRNVKAYFVS